MMMWIIYPQSREVIKVVVLVVRCILNDEEFRTMVFKISLVTGILPTVSEGKQDKTGARRLKAQN